VSIRAALGAGPAAIARLSSGDALRVTAIGVICGLAAATWLTRFLRTCLYGVDRLDPFALAGAVLRLAVVALVPRSCQHGGPRPSIRRPN
jgi:hypothetical protein